MNGVRLEEVYDCETNTAVLDRFCGFPGPNLFFCLLYDLGAVLDDVLQVWVCWEELQNKSPLFKDAR